YRFYNAGVVNDLAKDPVKDRDVLFRDNIRERLFHDLLRCITQGLCHRRALVAERPVPVQDRDNIGRFLNKGPEKFLVLTGLFFDCFIPCNIPDGNCEQDDLAFEVDDRIDRGFEPDRFELLFKMDRHFLGHVHIPDCHMGGEKTLFNEIRHIGTDKFRDIFTGLTGKGEICSKKPAIGVDKKEIIFRGVQKDACGLFTDPECMFHGIFIERHLDGGLQLQFAERLEDITERLGEFCLCKETVITVCSSPAFRTASSPVVAIAHTEYPSSVRLLRISMPVTASSSTTRIFTSPIMVSFSRFKSKINRVFRPVLSLQGKGALDLCHERVHQLQTQCLDSFQYNPPGQSHPVILHDKGIKLTCPPEFDGYGSRSVPGERIFQCIGEQFVDDEADGNCLADGQDHIGSMDLQPDLPGGYSIGLEQVFPDLFEIIVVRDTG